MSWCKIQHQVSLLAYCKYKSYFLSTVALLRFFIYASAVGPQSIPHRAPTC